ncbi:NAD(+) hydrolase sarm1-like [Mytilus californianus]|uniref:NAD(+) hydrolase sarm1-like n=1 Tax=Mytilus californianus TaxID=6549 RepID=UPI0022479C65|nr:NAD(+) hydrolase sarm1-like [Mytilus californianus]
MEKVEGKGTVRMVQSEAKFSGLPTDPYKALEISQSARTLLHDIEDDEEMTEKDHESPHHNVSECSKVYLDLAQAEHSDQRLVNNMDQDHLFKNGNEKCIFLSGNEDLNNYTLKNSESEDPHTTENTDWSSSLQHLTSQLKVKIEVIKQCTGDSHIQALHDISLLVEQAWVMPTKDVAHSLCDTLREEQALDILIGNCASQNKELMIASGRLLENILITRNRQRVVHYGLEILVKMAVDTKGEFDMARFCTGILESLFKISEEICRKLTVLGGLDVLLYWCRSNDRLTLRHCAIGLSNMALYCGPENQEEMAKHKVPEWLFPLAFNDDDSVRYYACLAISVLVANKEIESAVLQSGTLDLVLPFIASHSPSEFGRMDLSHRHGRSKEWSKRLVPLLSSKREESEALAAFHFAMEAGIKSLQKNTKIFYEIGAISPLKRLASSQNATTSKLACEALRIIGENLPHKLTAQVPVWTVEDVKFWVSQNGFEEFAVNFERCKGDGDLLLTLTEGDLSGSLHMKCRIAHKRFMRELKRLKITADYASSDPTKLDDFLMELGSEFSQYTYSMLQAGVDMLYLPYLTEEQLTNDCGISSGIHRSKILQKIRVLEEQKTEGDAGDIIDGRKVTDVFISYRRVNGSMLASLLKVFLQLRGFTVFLDIEKLNAGKFGEGLLSSVRSSRNFILVLTPNALDRCVGDKDKNDWVHREIVAALESQCNIIPIMDNFKWPLGDQLPEDMKQITFFNGIKWIHEYQDACVDKLERFMREEKLNNSMQGREPDFLLQKITEA